jgi:uncharacterized protein
MAAESPFIVEVRDLPTHRHADVPAAMVRDALAGLPIRDALEAPESAPAGGGAVDVDLYADGSHVFASGRVKGWVEVACSRCVGPVKIAVDEPVKVTFMPRHELAALEAAEDAEPAKPAEADEGPEVAAEDLDVFPYDGEKIDLTPLVREQLILAVPFAPLCREDCAGLCPQCGADKNAAPCTCDDQSPGASAGVAADPRFDALRGLKLPS